MMLNELVLGRRIALPSGAPVVSHDVHHSAEDWKAFFKALDRTTAFERRPTA